MSEGHTTLGDQVGPWDALGWTRLAARASRLSTAVLVLLALAACQDQSTDAVHAPEVRLAVVGGDAQTGRPWRELPIAVEVQALAGGLPVPDQVVNFVVVEGGGSVFAGTTVTDAQGIAGNYWTLGGPGPQTIEVRATEVGGLSTLQVVFETFTATAEVPELPEMAFVNRGRLGGGGGRGARLYAIGANGSLPVSLSGDAEVEGQPVWAPKPCHTAFACRDVEIAFVVQDGDASVVSDLEIYVMDGDGSDLTNLTKLGGDDREPNWSPDAARIAFSSTRDGNDEIYVMNADGSSPMNVSNDSGSDTGPRWSPDGTRIAFSSTRDGDSEIYVVDADGSNPTNLTNEPEHDVQPAWSPDGTKIAFVTERDGDREIYVADADGSNQERLTDRNEDDEGPAWSPDGTKIAFISFLSGLPQIYVMNADGSGQVELTSVVGGESDQPAWSCLAGYGDGDSGVTCR